MPVIVTKQIRPQRLDINAIRIELEKAVTFEGNAILKEYEKTTATWKHKPEFETLPEVSSTEVSVLVGTDDEIYNYVDKGTRPHVIVPKRASFLRFQVGYRAKTTPNVVGSKAGGKFGKVLYRQRVYHPGFPGRNFTRIIQQRRKRPFQRAMLKAAKKGAKIANRRGQL